MLLWAAAAAMILCGGGEAAAAAAAAAEVRPFPLDVLLERPECMLHSQRNEDRILQSTSPLLHREVQLWNFNQIMPAVGMRVQCYVLVVAEVRNDTLINGTKSISQLDAFLKKCIIFLSRFRSLAGAGEDSGPPESRRRPQLSSLQRSSGRDIQL